MEFTYFDAVYNASAHCQRHLCSSYTVPFRRRRLPFVSRITALSLAKIRNCGHRILGSALAVLVLVLAAVPFMLFVAETTTAPTTHVTVSASATHVKAAVCTLARAEMQLNKSEGNIKAQYTRLPGSSDMAQLP